MKTRSLKQGSTPAERALLLTITVANTNPPVAGTDQPMAMYGPLAACDLVFEETAGGTCDLEVFHYYLSADKFVRDATIGTVNVLANSISGIVLTPSAADGIYIAVSNFAANGEITVWAQAKYA